MFRESMFCEDMRQSAVDNAADVLLSAFYDLVDAPQLLHGHLSEILKIHQLV